MEFLLCLWRTSRMQTEKSTEIYVDGRRTIETFSDLGLGKRFSLLGEGSLKSLENKKNFKLPC